jgi:hypothetical protein
MPPFSRRFAWRATYPVMGGLLLMGGMGLSSCEKPAPPAPKAAGVNLTSKLNAARAEVAALEEAALQDFRALKARRANLATSSPAEVEAYNRDVAHYQMTREALRLRQEELKMMVADEAASRETAAGSDKARGH